MTEDRGRVCGGGKVRRPIDPDAERGGIDVSVAVRLSLRT
jgi:hypothetical protein